MYIPIIHTDPDLGSLAADVEEKAGRLIGSYWREHKKTIESYWKEIDRFVVCKQFTRVVVFQDGLPAGGETAQVMIETLAQTGSPNYQLLKRLIQKGARMQKTEDPELLKQEYQLTKNLVARKNLVSAVFAFLKYKLRKNSLLRARDAYIAERINQNLKIGETGICFLGAYHDILSQLASDIKIVQLKDPEKVRKYYQRLTYGETVGAINGLARYLTKPIKAGVVFHQTHE